MATLYWGGGTGTWDGFTTGKWYTDFARTVLSTRAPSAEDDVIFDSASNATAYTVTLADPSPSCRSCTISGPATGNLTLEGYGNWYIYGSLTLPATGLTRTYGGSIFFYATDSRTITTNGVALASAITFAGTGGTWTLQDALNNGASGILINAGTFNTNGKNLTCGTLTATTGSTAGTLTLGASTVSATTFPLNAPVVVNAGTSNITLSSAVAGIGGGANYTGNTFYNVTFSNNSITKCNIYGNNTFNNLTFTTAALFDNNIVLYGNNTVNGTLTIPGQLGSRRYFVQSDTIGTARTLTVATVAALTDVDFRDITVAGASAPWSGTRLGNCLGNTNITFAAGTNKYIASGLVSPINWFQNIWATSSGGSAATANFPLAQDTVIIDNAGLGASGTLNIDTSHNIGTINASTRTNAITIGLLANNNIYGNFTLSTNVTTSNNSIYAWIYAGRTTQNITTSGKIIYGFNVNSPGGTVKLLDALDVSTSTITLSNGTFDANNQNITADNITASGTASKTLTLGSGTITLATSGIIVPTISNLTVTSNTATINFTAGGVLGFTGITATFGGTVTVSGAASSFAVAGTTTVANLTIANAPTGTAPTDKLILYGNLTVTGTLALAGGTSVTQRAVVRSDTLGTQRTLSAATVTGLTDIDFRDINATGAANWTTGTRLGDCGGNAGITFPAAKTVYWNLTGTQNWSATAWATSSGGSPAANNFPLAQDTAVFNNTGAASLVIINAAWNIGTINASGRTSAWTLSGTAGPSIYGDVTYGSGVSATISNLYTFSGRGTQTYTTAGKTLANSFAVNKPAGTFQHGDAYTSTSSTSITITAGTYTTQNYNISAAGISSSNSNTRSITLGTSTLTLSGAAPITFTTSTGLTFSGASSTINLSSTSAKTFAGGGQIFNAVSSTGGTTNPLTISGSNKFTTLTNTARTYLIFTSGTTQEATNFTYSGVSGSVVRWYTSIPGQRATIKTTSSAVGTNSINGGNNTGLTFTGTSPDYFYVKDIAYSAIAVSGGNFLMFFN